MPNSTSAQAPRPVPAPSHVEDRPLSVWRLFGPDQISPAIASLIRAEITGCLSLYDRRWPAAADDAGAAIGIALDHMREGPRGAAGDLAMSALLLHSVRGHPAAALVLAHALAALSRRNDDPDLYDLAERWSTRAPDMGPLAP